MKRYVFIFLFAFSFLFSSFNVSASELDDNGVTNEDEFVIDVLPEESEDDSQIPSVDNSLTTYDLSTLEYAVLSSDDSLVSLMEFDDAKEFAIGFLLNRSNLSDYLFFESDIDGLTHYYLFYDLVVVDDSLADGFYNYVDMYFLNGFMYLDFGSSSVPEVPSVVFGSFGNYSALIDRQLHFNNFYLVIVGVVVMFILFRKRVFT